MYIWNSWSRPDTVLAPILGGLAQCFSCYNVVSGNIIKLLVIPLESKGLFCVSLWLPVCLGKWIATRLLDSNSDLSVWDCFSFLPNESFLSAALSGYTQLCKTLQGPTQESCVPFPREAADEMNTTSFTSTVQSRFAWGCACARARTHIHTH